MAGALTGYLFETSVMHRLNHKIIADAVHRRGTDRLLFRCAMVELEVQFSAISPANDQRSRDLLHGVFADLPITPEIMQRALAVQQQLVEVSQHRGVSPADLIIAACAEVHGATVVHYDADYDRIAQITGQPMQWVVPAGSVD